MVKTGKLRVGRQKPVHIVHIGPLPPLCRLRQTQAHLRHGGILLFPRFKGPHDEPHGAFQLLRGVVAALLPAVPCPLRLIDGTDIFYRNTGVDVAFRHLCHIVGIGLIAVVTEIGNEHALLPGFFRGGLAVFRHGGGRRIHKQRDVRDRAELHDLLQHRPATGTAADVIGAGLPQGRVYVAPFGAGTLTVGAVVSDAAADVDAKIVQTQTFVGKKKPQRGIDLRIQTVARPPPAGGCAEMTDGLMALPGKYPQAGKGGCIHRGYLHGLHIHIISVPCRSIIAQHAALS